MIWPEPHALTREIVWAKNKMAAPWICPRCGTATNTDNCPNCLYEAPVRVAAYNQPGSWFAIIQGPNGCAGLSRGAGIGCLILFLTPLVLIVWDSIRRLR